MQKQPGGFVKLYVLAGFLCTWIALILQFYLIIVNRQTTVFTTIIRYFSYFTILTNILAALCFTVRLFQKRDRQKHFLLKPSTLAAVTVYITVVGLVYNIILRPLWSPTGLQQVVDEMLHSLNPLLFLVYWLLFVSKKDVQWKQVFPWLIYPLVYLVYTFMHGALSGFYPYPFVDVNSNGYGKTLINCAVLCGVFLFFSVLFVGIAKLGNRR